jgi:uncharacterized membrane protein
MRPLNTLRPAQANIELVAQMEREFLEKRTLADRLGDAVVAVIGTPAFLLLHAAVFLLWILINIGKLKVIPAFDPFPFVLLTMVVSMEGVLLAVFILMKQNRIGKRADQRDHLHLQINLLAEKEITKVLRIQRLICGHFGIQEPSEDATETEELSTHTAVESLAREMEKKLPT